MKKFSHVNASTFEEAVSILNQYDGQAKIIAGGTDLLGQIKNTIHFTQPKVLVNIKTIPNMQYIEEYQDGLRMGALTKLKDIASNAIIRDKFTALAQAAHAVASPQIRNMGTLGGNLCQDSRCWYYRATKNYFPCMRKKAAGKEAKCYAPGGDHRYHSIFGAVKKCFAVNPSDIAPALIALNARIKTTRQIIEAGRFFEVGPEKTTILAPDEILTEIQIPSLKPETKSIFLKYAFRKAIDFPIVNCAIALSNEKGTIKKVRICLNAVHNLPYRPLNAEKCLENQVLDETIAIAVSEKALEDAKPLRNNKYMVPIAKQLIQRALLSLK